ncbi:MAG: hypothetical protein KDD06_08715 [Phaeodactylibacter sp.]|nr:hypothetical protein [Phaeodactylibacter sp.]
MHQSKLIALLRKLSTRQLNRFGDFLQSPYYNKSKENCLFFGYLSGFAPSFDGPGLEKKAVMKANPTEAKLDDQALAYRMSELMQLLEQFLSVEYLKENPLEEQWALMETYSRLGLDKHYNTARKRSRKFLKKYPFRDAAFLQAKYRLAEMENRNAPQYERRHREELQRAADALDRAYLMEKLRYSLEMVNSAQMLDIHYDLQLGDPVLRWLQEKPLPDAPGVGIYLYALLMLQQPEEQEHYRKLYGLLRENEALLPPEELKNLYTYLLNYCTRRINRYRDKAYYGHFLDINLALIDKGLLLENGALAPWRYSNLVTVGLVTGRLEWAHQFLEEYKSLLPEAFRENIYNYNRAHYLYYTKEYEEAQVILNQLGLQDLLLAIAAKNLLAKIYYETGQTELLLSFLEAYRIYIYRQDLAKPRLKQQARNFIDVIRKLAKLAPFEAEKRKALADNLPPGAEILERDWLLRMMGGTQ